MHLLNKHDALVNIYAFVILMPYSCISVEITLLEFEEAEEGNPQEDPQAVAPEGVEQNPKELPECPDHRPTSFLRGKPRSIISLPVIYKGLLKYL